MPSPGRAGRLSRSCLLLNRNRLLCEAKPISRGSSSREREEQARRTPGSKYDTLISGVYRNAQSWITHLLTHPRVALIDTTLASLTDGSVCETSLPRRKLGVRLDLFTLGAGRQTV